MRRFVSTIFAFALVVAACGADAVETTSPGDTGGGVATTQPADAPGDTTGPTEAPPASGGPLYDDWARLGDATRDLDQFSAAIAEASALIPDTVPIDDAWYAGFGATWHVDGCHAGFQMIKTVSDDYDDVVPWLIAEAESAGWSVTTSAWTEVDWDGNEAEGTALQLAGLGEPWQIYVVATPYDTTDIRYCLAG